MVCTERNFEVLAKLYNKVIVSTLAMHDVKEVRCVATKEHFFDRIVLKDDHSLEVYKYGLTNPFSWLSFDFTIDFSQCLANIEHDLFLAQRNGKPERGMIFTFNDKK